jgi:hypothetical protein
MKKSDMKNKAVDCEANALGIRLERIESRMRIIERSGQTGTADNLYAAAQMSEAAGVIRSMYESAIEALCARVDALEEEGGARVKRRLAERVRLAEAQKRRAERDEKYGGFLTHQPYEPGMPIPGRRKQQKRRKK